MKILVVNDDGYQSFVSNSFVMSLRAKGHEVYSFFPESNYSGAGSSITLKKEVEYYQSSPTDYIVKGTPTDCCLLGLEMVPSTNLIISGINKGLNIGLGRKYSGTIGAMKEGIARDIPCVSISADEAVYQQLHIHTSEFSRLFRLIEYYMEQVYTSLVFGMNINIVNLKKTGIIELENDSIIVKGSLVKVRLKESEKSFSYVINPEISNTSINGDLLVGFVFDPFYQKVLNEEFFIKKISEIWYNN